jgi:integrase
VLGTPAGASALEAAFTAAFGQLAPATRVRHLSALRSALASWAEAGWVTADPTAGWARPKVPVDTTRALTRAQVAAIWKLDVPLRDKALWRMLYETAARAEEISTTHLFTSTTHLFTRRRDGTSSPRARPSWPFAHA